MRESVVLLKNEAAILPLSSSLSHIHVIGTGADDIGFQSGAGPLNGKVSVEISQKERLY